MMQRVMPELMALRNIMVLNDRAPTATAASLVRTTNDL